MFTHAREQVPLQLFPQNLPQELLQLLPQLPEHPVSHEPAQSPEQLPEQLPPQFIGVEGLSDPPKILFAFDILEIPEITKAPSIGRTIPAALLKNRLRVIISSDLSILSVSFPMLKNYSQPIPRSQRIIV